MKHQHLILLALFLAIACGPKPETNSETPVANQSGYDSLMAVETGADQYGMRKYVMAFLKAGPVRSQNKQEADSLQRLHMDNINRLAEAGKLVMAGPFMDNGELRGIYIFAVESVEEAEELTKTDPSIQAGRLVMELRPWYGSAALMKMGSIHEKISKISI